MTILDKIVADTRDLVARRKQKIPVSSLKDFPYYQSPTLSFEAALRSRNLAIIAEIKKASPSKGVIRHDFDVQEIAREYKLNGASAISVLTEPDYFQGSLENLKLARQAVDLPLLRKDFIIDPYQVYEARAYGADGILLIAAVLEKNQLRDLHDAAASLGLSCLVEVYDIQELDRIDFDQVRILGVNNRNLHTFTVDIDHSLRVFEVAPVDLVRVSESGLRTAADLTHLRRNGIDAVLIGERFMQAREPGLMLRKLNEETRSLLASNSPTSTLRLAV